MIAIKKPNTCPKKLYKQCVGSRRAGPVQTELRSIEPDIKLAIAEYNLAANSLNFFSIKPLSKIRNTDGKLLNKLYEDKIGSKRGIARSVYDEIILAAPNGLCPICLVSPVNNLDHYLSKAKHPKFSVLPKNLLPLCISCNFTKSSFQPTCYEDQLIHPYFDKVQLKPWLNVKILNTTPLSVRFFVDDFGGIQQANLKRIEYTFKKLKLDRAYAAKAAQKLVYICNKFTKIERYKKDVGLRQKVLMDMCEGLEQEHNSWEGVLLRHLSQKVSFYTKDYLRVATPL